MGKPYVFALSSYTAGGKTTLARYLASMLNAASLFWDEYDEAGFMTHPKDFKSWLAEGADNNAWKVPRLAEDLAKLKRGETIIYPLTARASPRSSTSFLTRPSVTPMKKRVAA
jgi:uridine kinase